MDAILLGITAISLALAVVMGIVLFRLLREEQLRSEARVALLSAAAGEIPSHMPGTEGDPAEGGAAQPWWKGRRAAAAAAGIFALAVFALVVGTGTDTPPSRAAMPLDLLTLHHETGDGNLTVTGLVRNPAGNRAAQGVVATVALFGPDGQLRAAGRAGLDDPTLPPGGDSPFVIKVAVTGTVSRYRVGFRGPDGEVLAHVDRRTDAPAARSHGSGGTPWVD